DELEGRDTPSRGLNIAAKFLAPNLLRWGFTPAGDSGSYFQRMALQRSRIQAEQTTVEIDGQKFSYGSDFIATPVQSLVSAPLVYVKNGYIVRKKEINPYAGIDVRGKIMVMLGGYPKGVTLADFGGKKGIDYDTPSNYAKNNGALGILSIPSMQALVQWDKNRKSYVEKGDLSLAYFLDKEKQDVVSVSASQKMIEALFAGEGIQTSMLYDRASSDSIQPFEFSKTKKVTLNISTIIDTQYTQNVVATLEGSDKQLKNEYVAFGAHYDHVGIGKPVNGDSIYNGADDDGSGTVAILACAETFAKGDRPKRSLLFVWHTGEEKGLWGSKYYVAQPTVPLSSVITQLNMDMIGRSRPDTGEGSSDENFSSSHEVFVIGSKMMSSTLGALTEETNASLLNMKLNYKFDDPNDPLKLFYRSDHYNYAKNGIPIVFFFDGIHEDYHKVSDEIEKIDFDKYLKVTKTVFALGWKLANLPKRPAADKTFPREAFE
ncbi:MAG: M28 family peptidase, partial [Ignavibacteriales bacterium]|nr:M28 family peptidase [Ignavibacteriales bacterium]